MVDQNSCEKANDPPQKRGLAGKYGKGKSQPKQVGWKSIRESKVANPLTHPSSAGAIPESEKGPQLRVAIRPGWRCLECVF